MPDPGLEASVPPETKSIVVERPPETASSDNFARMEESAITENRLNEHRRDDRLHNHLHLATVCVIWGVAIGVSVMALVWLYHMVAPTQYAFLTETQFSRLNMALLSAIGSSFVTEQSKKLSGSKRISTSTQV